MRHVEAAAAGFHVDFRVPGVAHLGQRFENSGQRLLAHGLRNVAQQLHRGIFSDIRQTKLLLLVREIRCHNACAQQFRNRLADVEIIRKPLRNEDLPDLLRRERLLHLAQQIANQGFDLICMKQAAVFHAGRKSIVLIQCIDSFIS